MPSTGRTQTLARVILPMLADAGARHADRIYAGIRAVGQRIRIGDLHGRQPCYVSQIAPLLIVIKLEGSNHAGATAIATIMLALSFLMLRVINLVQAWSRGSFGYA